MKQFHHVLPMKNAIRLEEHLQKLKWNGCGHSESHRAGPKAGQQHLPKCLICGNRGSSCCSRHAQALSRLSKDATVYIATKYCRGWSVRSLAAETPDVVKSPVQGFGRSSLLLTPLESMWPDGRSSEKPGKASPTPCLTRPSSQ